MENSERIGAAYFKRKAASRPEGAAVFVERERPYRALRDDLRATDFGEREGHYRLRQAFLARFFQDARVFGRWRLWAQQLGYEEAARPLRFARQQADDNSDTEIRSVAEERLRLGLEDYRAHRDRYWPDARQLARNEGRRFLLGFTWDERPCLQPWVLEEFQDGFQLYLTLLPYSGESRFVRVSPPRPAKGAGRLPRSEVESRYLDWFYRHVLNGEHLEAIAIAHYGEIQGPGQEHHISTGIQRALDILSCGAHDWL
jgi:hypothetical protein